MPCHRRTGQAQPYTCQQPRYTAREKRQRKRWAIYDDDLVMKALFTLLSSPKDRCYSIYRHNRVRGRMTDLSGTAKHSSRKETVWRFLGRVPCWQVTHEFAKRPHLHACCLFHLLFEFAKRPHLHACCLFHLLFRCYNVLFFHLFFHPPADG